MNQLQIKFAFTFLTLVGYLLTAWFFFSAYIYEFVVYQKPMGFALMSSLPNWIYLVLALAFVTFTNIVASEPQIIIQIIGNWKTRFKRKPSTKQLKKPKPKKEEKYPTW